jgi:hypothetical protein
MVKFPAINNQLGNCTGPTDVHFIFNEADLGFGMKKGK